MHCGPRFSARNSAEKRAPVRYAATAQCAVMEIGNDHDRGDDVHVDPVAATRTAV